MFISWAGEAIGIFIVGAIGTNILQAATAEHETGWQGAAPVFAVVIGVYLLAVVVAFIRDLR